jgi:hypothetical protein
MSMSTKSRQTIYGGSNYGRERAESARKRTAEAARETDRAEGRSRWKAMAGRRNRRRPSGNVSMADTAG